MPQEQLNQQKLNQNRAQTSQEPDEESTQTKQPSSSKKITGVEFALVGMLCVVKDSLDVVCTLSVFLAVLVTIINLPITAILWFWCFWKLHKFPSKRFIGASLVEFVPVLGALPTWTFFIITLYLEEGGYLPGFLKRKIKPVSVKA
ncbi:MAG: hypothetical protein HY764_03995 [Candidatus Portnoybacteria bacterium]|nr:hypothetical protein [Candidatus Portnoybacteria bacterium]